MSADLVPLLPRPARAAHLTVVRNDLVVDQRGDVVELRPPAPHAPRHRAEVEAEEATRLGRIGVVVMVLALLVGILASVIWPGPWASAGWPL